MSNLAKKIDIRVLAQTLLLVIGIVIEVDIPILQVIETLLCCIAVILFSNRYISQTFMIASICCGLLYYTSVYAVAMFGATAVIMVIVDRKTGNTGKKHIIRTNRSYIILELMLTIVTAIFVSGASSWLVTLTMIALIGQTIAKFTVMIRTKYSYKMLLIYTSLALVIQIYNSYKLGNMVKNINELLVLAICIMIYAIQCFKTDK